MINQHQLPDYVGKAIPELTPALSEKGNCDNVYQMMHVLRDYTHAQVQEGNVNAVKKCLQLAEKLYTKGNIAIKNAIENVYIYSFSQILTHDDNKNNRILSLMPAAIYTLYVKQMLHSHL